jgi:hypothetical protein
MRQGERQWFQARLRWAVMEEGRGLDHWREAEHIFQSDSREAAFAEALADWPQPGVCRCAGSWPRHTV